MGSVLYQENEKGEPKVIAFASRTLTKAEFNYTITEKETLSVVFAMTKFQTYFLNSDVVVQTDHQAITFFKNCKMSHGRLTRWMLQLQEYRIKWEYLPGSKNIVADILSRVGCQEEIIAKEAHKILACFRNKEELKLIVEEIKKLQPMDIRIQKLRERTEATSNTCLLYTSRCV